MRPSVLRAVRVLLLAAWSSGPAPAAAPFLSVGEWPPSQPAAARSETLWIFDADFENCAGDNAGWLVFDESQVRPVPNYWHTDSFNAYPDGNSPDSSFWCGKCDQCWVQPCGYGNNWLCSLSRVIDLSGFAGRAVTLSFRQKLAMEKDYDHGYVDVSADSGAHWTSIYSVTNPGFEGTAGASQDWSSPLTGLVTLDLSAYAGAPLDVRWRFDSDGANSAQDQPDNPPWHSVREGAWYIDEVVVSSGSDTIFQDGFEPPAAGWDYADVLGIGQKGTWYRAVNPPAGEPRPDWAGETQLVAIDPQTQLAPEGQRAVFVSPPIPISGLPDLVTEWRMWACFPAAGPPATFEVWSFSRPDTLYCGYTPFYEPNIVWIYRGTCGWIRRVTTDLWPTYDSLRFYGRQTVQDPPVPGCTGVYVDRVRVGCIVPTAVPEREPVASGLSAVLPNPSRGSTRITYSLSAPSAVNVAVYDLTGRVVRTLVNGVVEPGEHEVVWDGVTETGVRAASGVYFVKLAAGDGSASEAKLVFVR